MMMMMRRRCFLIEPSFSGSTWSKSHFDWSRTKERTRWRGNFLSLTHIITAGLAKLAQIVQPSVNCGRPAPVFPRFYPGRVGRGLEDKEKRRKLAESSHLSVQRIGRKRELECRIPKKSGAKREISFWLSKEKRKERNETVFRFEPEEEESVLIRALCHVHPDAYFFLRAAAKDAKEAFVVFGAQCILFTEAVAASVQRAASLCECISFITYVKKKQKLEHLRNKSCCT